MEGRSVFRSPEDAIATTWRFIPHLARLWLWMLVAVAHMALLLAFLLAAWVCQWTPVEVVKWIDPAVHSRATAAFLFLGGSILGLGWGYWKLVRWIHRASYSGWLFRYLNKP